MNIAGQNLYRVTYRINHSKLKDQEFQKLVVAFSEKEAAAIIGPDVATVSLVEQDISLHIPDQYLPQGRKI